MIVGRLLLRLLIVPLGGLFAVCVAMLFVMFAQWNRMTALNGDDYSGLTTFFVMVPMLLVGSGIMLWPATLGAMVAEAFAIRSWMFHAANGGLSAAVSLVRIGGFEKDYDLSAAPLIAIGAGIVAGFAYWMVAGWSAGFWKPVFAPPQTTYEPPPATLPITPKNEIAGNNPAIRDSSIRVDN